jgi:hypothetical protein
MFKLAALVVVVALLNLLGSAHANIIGIDFASDSIKVAIVQPGTPLEIGKQDVVQRSSVGAVVRIPCLFLQ